MQRMAQFTEPESSGILEVFCSEDGQHKNVFRRRHH